MHVDPRDFEVVFPDAKACRHTVFATSDFGAAMVAFGQLKDKLGVYQGGRAVEVKDLTTGKKTRGTLSLSIVFDDVDFEDESEAADG